ncbi:type II and III secretion system protein [Hydrogenobacter thermophilus TK-6]|uniref:Putative type IV pilus biogenesis protein n=1 Tax=Hydrogenobacter thermophilus (strain DSM 6534 / IAM 12695 / TK-6) TaxID=608538 RepID=D3DJU4_HYDTT|nr:type IV pilus biogenesis protein [Hydrogenobacter thermophilus]ADO46018.1 type II and III secretion system protein [Hydrogenobacter thermophilus TK-6]BAI70096.1 putative type IV pilus biogenesis protein [Hydrogenobacter thermophilus TK-6]
MRRALLTFLLLLCVSFGQTVKEMKFENVKLETVLKALSQVADMNVIFDPQIAQDVSKPVSVSIYKPVPVGEALNIILKEYGLIAVPVDRKVYRITKAGELSISLSGLDDRQIEEFVKFLKPRVSPSAEIVIDKTLKMVYIRDEERNIKKLEPVMKDYAKIVEKIAPAEERTTRVFYLKNISLDEAERLISSYKKPDTVITKVPSFSALVITDSPRQLEKYQEVLKNFLSMTPTERKPVTKIFYLKYISPDEFIKMIEPLRSESGVILSGGAVKLQQPTSPAPASAQVQQQQQQAPPTPILKEFNAVMLTDYPEVIEKIRERFKDYISDSPVQVKIEARIVEVREQALRELGINWNVLLSQARVPQFWQGGAGQGANIGVAPAPGTIFVPPDPTSVGPRSPIYYTPGLSQTPGGIFAFSYQKGMLNALNLRLSALERIAMIKNIAKPTVVTVNAQKATIKQGVQIPYQTTVVAGGAQAANIQFKDVVLQLDVTPVVSPDGRILLDINLKRDTPGEQTPQGPAINTKEASTKVVVNDGDTLVIGGIIDNQETKTNEGLPGLVRVPVLKWLFGQESSQKIQSELLIFLTPVLVRQ